MCSRRELLVVSVALLAAVCARGQEEVDPDARRAADVLYNQAVNEQDLKTKIDLYRECLRIYPEHRNAWINLGLALKDMGDLDRALQSFQEAEKIDPAYYKPHWNMAYIYERQDKLPEALTEWKETLKSYGMEETQRAYVVGRIQFIESALALAVAEGVPDRVWYLLGGDLYYARLGDVALRQARITMLGDISWAALSPATGNYIAFLRGNSQLYIFEVAAHQAVPLDQDNPRPILSLAWDPTGKNLAYVRAAPDRADVGDVFVLNALARQVLQVTNDGTWSEVAWSANAKSLLLVKTSEGQDAGLWMLDLEAGGQQRIAPPVERMRTTRPQASPGGNLIAFLRVREDGKHTLAVVSLADGQVVDPQAPVIPDSVQWDSTGKFVLYRPLAAFEGVWYWDSRIREVRAVLQVANVQSFAASPTHPVVVACQADLQPEGIRGDTVLWLAGLEKPPGRRNVFLLERQMYGSQIVWDASGRSFAILQLHATNPKRFDVVLLNVAPGGLNPMHVVHEENAPAKPRLIGITARPAPPKSELPAPVGGDVKPEPKPPGPGGELLLRPGAGFPPEPAGAAN